MSHNAEMRNLLNVMEAGFNPDKHEMNDEQIAMLADDALNAACLAVQDALGVESGDVAGIFFTGENEQKFHDLFKKYIKYELMHLTNDSSGAGEI